jgi:type II secretory pathway pseudopilin PulG
MLKKLTSNQRGDTIIEVLLCIAIAGSVITGAYALASRSLAEGVSASEHSQAIKIAESQIEALKSRQRDALTNQDAWIQNFAPPNPISAATLNNFSNFCLVNGTVTMLDVSGAVAANWKSQRNGTANGAFTATNLDASNPPQQNTYNLACTDTGVAANAKFFTNITLIPTSNAPTYLVTVRWAPAGNAPTSQTQLYYRTGDYVNNTAP